eukprot:PhF_6_TR8352/c2_g1_i1/m.13097
MGNALRSRCLSLHEGPEITMSTVNWKTYEAVLKDETRAVTLFVCTDPTSMQYAKELIHKLKITRHPGVLRFRATANDEKCFVLAVDPVIPVVAEIPRCECISEIAYGLDYAFTTMQWLRNEGGMAGLGIALECVFVSTTQEGRPWVVFPDPAILSTFQEFSQSVLKLCSQLPAPQETPSMQQSLTLLEAVHGFAMESDDEKALPLHTCRWFSSNPFVLFINNVLSISTRTDTENEIIFADSNVLLQAIPPSVINRRILPIILTARLLSKTYAEPFFSFIFSVPQLAETIMNFYIECFSVKDLEIRTAVLRYFPRICRLIPIETLASKCLDEIMNGLTDVEDNTATQHLKCIALASRELLRRNPPTYSELGIPVEDIFCRKVNVSVVYPLYTLALDSQNSDEYRCSVLGQLLRLWDAHPKIVRGMILSALNYMVYEQGDELREKAVVTLQSFLHDVSLVQGFAPNELTYLILPIVTPLCVDVCKDVRSLGANLSLHVLQLIQKTTNEYLATQQQQQQQQESNTNTEEPNTSFSSSPPATAVHPPQMSRIQLSSYLVSPKVEKWIQRKAIFPRKRAMSVTH